MRDCNNKHQKYVFCASCQSSILLCLVCFFSNMTITFWVSSSCTLRNQKTKLRNCLLLLITVRHIFSHIFAFVLLHSHCLYLWMRFCFANCPMTVFLWHWITAILWHLTFVWSFVYHAPFPAFAVVALMIHVINSTLTVVFIAKIIVNYEDKISAARCASARKTYGRCWLSHSCVRANNGWCQANDFLRTEMPVSYSHGYISAVSQLVHFEKSEISLLYKWNYWSKKMDIHLFLEKDYFPWLANENIAFLKTQQRT